MRVVVNADDFGLSDETVDATIECFEQGALTSATIMPNAPATERALAYAAGHGEFSFGVHLTLVGDGDDRPILPPDQIPGLVQPDGTLPATNVVRLRALLRRLDARELDREIAAQIAVVHDAGVPVSHVDSHRHLHKFRPVLDSLARVLPGLGISRVRNVQDVYVGTPIASPTYWLGRAWRRRLQTRFSTTQHFFMSAGTEEGGWERQLVDRIPRLPGPTLEIGVHPGRAEPWREAEQRSVVACTTALRKQGHVLVDWRAVDRPRLS
jgi:predicted glycoside hydrolase/deacetylase ChbG (UPF0249 family)